MPARETREAALIAEIIAGLHQNISQSFGGRNKKSKG